MKKRPKISKAEYSRVHSWMRRHYGKADRCESKKCDGKSTCYNWAKIKNKEYETNRKNFKRLCSSCHKKYDFTDEMRKGCRERNLNTWKTHCKRGHKFDKQNIIVIKVKGGISNRRACRKCTADIRKRSKTKNKETIRLQAKQKYNEMKKPCPQCSKIITFKAKLCRGCEVKRRTLITSILSQDI